MRLRRGSVVLCRVPMPSEQLQRFKHRPAVVVSKNTNNDRLDDVVIAICTSNILRTKEPTQYLLDGNEVAESGIRIPSVVRCESLLTINKSMIIKVLGKLSGEGIRRVNACLKDALGLQE